MKHTLMRLWREEEASSNASVFTNANACLSRAGSNCT